MVYTLVMRLMAEKARKLIFDRFLKKKYSAQSANIAAPVSSIPISRKRSIGKILFNKYSLETGTPIVNPLENAPD